MKYANLSGVVTWSQGKMVLSKGTTTAEDDHPLVVERPDLWDDVEPGARLHSPEAPVERATRAPGEKRPGRPRLPRNADGEIIRD